MRARFVLFALVLVSNSVLGEEPALRLHAVGSLRAVVTEMAQGPRRAGYF